MTPSTIHGMPLFDVVEYRDDEGRLLFVEATPEKGDRRIYRRDLLRLDASCPARRSTDPENKPAN